MVLPTRKAEEPRKLQNTLHPSPIHHNNLIFRSFNRVKSQLDSSPLFTLLIFPFLQHPSEDFQRVKSGCLLSIGVQSGYRE